MRYFYGAAHEQFPPSVLLRHALQAERAGFDGVFCSDHFQPWWEPGESGQAWMWLGAAAQATTSCQLGPAVTPALARYHPALVAQAFATLAEMFPDRVFLAMGSGESLNESPFGYQWPDGEGQLAAFEEALSLVRHLWQGERIDFKGKFFSTKAAMLHTRPAQPPPLYISAFHPRAARLAARHGDGLWTLADPEAAPALIEIYRAERAELVREPGEIILQASVSYGATDELALAGARVWKGAQPAEYYVDDWHDPAEMYRRSEELISDSELKRRMVISAEPAEIVERLRGVEELGATTVAIMNCSGVAPEQAIDVYGRTVLPQLKKTDADQLDAARTGSVASDRA